MGREYDKFVLVVSLSLFGIPFLTWFALVIDNFIVRLAVLGFFCILLILAVRDVRQEKKLKHDCFPDYVPDEDFKGLDKLTDELPICGCGDPGGQLRLLLDLLKLGNYSENEEAINELFKENPERMYEFYFGVMDHVGLVTHGISIRGASLTDKGKAFLQTTDADIEKWEEQFDE